MFTSNTSEKQFEDYQERFEEPKVESFEIKKTTLDETKILVVWSFGPETIALIPADEMESLNCDQAITDYLEENCID